MTNVLPATLLVVNADDLGLAHGFNTAVRECHLQGILTSASLMVNGCAFEAAVDEVVRACPDLGIGIHLNIVEGRSLRPAVPRSSPLCDAGGTYRISFPRLLASQSRKELLAEIERDFRAQIERAMRFVPAPDHLNSHQHSHAVPAVFDLTCRLAREYGIPFVRLTREPLHAASSGVSHLRPWYAANLVKVALLNACARRDQAIARRYGVATNERMVGIAYTGHMNKETVLAGVRSAGPANLTEVLLHPCRMSEDRPESYLSPVTQRYMHDPGRMGEYHTLLDPALLRALNGPFSLSRYRDAADGHRPSSAVEKAAQAVSPA